MRRLLGELENILQELETNEARNKLIWELDKAILRSTFSPQEVFDLIIQKCLSTTNARHSQVVQYRRNKLTIVASVQNNSTSVKNFHFTSRSAAEQSLMERHNTCGRQPSAAGESMSASIMKP
jgi:hypothetical protein